MATLEKLYNDLGNIYGKAPYSLEQFKEYSANSASLGKLYDNIANSGRVNMGGMSRDQFIEKFMNADDRIPDRQAITGMPSEYKYSILDYSLDEIEKAKAESKEIAKKEAEAAMPKRDQTTIPYKPEEFTGGLYNYGQIVPGVVDEYAKEPVKPITQQDVQKLGRTIDQFINKAENVIQPQKSNVSSQYKRQFTKGFEERAIDAQERLANDPIAWFEDQLLTIEINIREKYKNKKESNINPLIQGILRQENVIIPGESGPNNTERATLGLIYKARNVLDMYKRKDKSGLSNFFDSLNRSIDTGILTFGISDVMEMSEILAVSNKINASENGFDKLREDEKQLMAAYSLLDQIQNSLQLSNSQRWGQGTVDSLEFMLSFAASGGIASAATKGIKKGVETAAKKVIKETARNVVRRATQKGVGRVAANVAKKTGNIALDGIVTGLVMPLTGGIGYTTAEIERRLIGTPDVEIGYDGEYKFKGITGQETLGGAIAKGLASQAIEYGVEGIGKYIGLNAGKLFSKFPGAARLLTKPIPKRFSKTMNRIARLSGFNGFIPEVAEEEIGMILNAAILGETKWEDITDLQNQLDILVQVGIISGGFQIANFSSTGYHYNKYREARRQYEAIDYGKGSKIEDIDAILESTPIDQRTDVIDAIANSYNFDNADKAKLANYVMRKTNYDFILGEIQDRAQQAGDEAAKNEMRFINEAMGGKVYVTLSDGRTAVVTSGQLSTEKGEDGLYSTTNGSDSVVVIPTDVEGAKPMLVSMKDIANIDAITPTEQALREAREAAKDMQVETDAAAIEAEANQEGQGQKEYLPYIEMNEDQQSPVYKENDDVVYIDSMGQRQEGTVKSVQPDGVNIVSVVNGIPQEDFVTFDNVQPKQVQQTQEQIEGTTGEEQQTQAQQPQSIYEEQEIQSGNNRNLAEETQPTAEENTQVSEPRVAQAIETEAPAIAAEETAPKSEEQEGTDRWAQYRKPNGEVDTKKITFQEQMEYGEESLGVEEMVTLAKNGVNATQKKINSLQKQYENEIDPGKKVSKKKQLDALQERLKVYQDYLEANDENRQAVAQTPQNLIGRLNALGDIRSLRDFILREIASGNAKFKWGDRDNGTKGLGSHLGMKNSPTERKMRISLLSNSGYTPEEFAHYIWEMQDAKNSNLPFRNYDTEEILGEVMDVLESVYSPKQALEQAENLRDKEIQQLQEKAEVEKQQEASRNTEDQQIEPAKETEPVKEELPFEPPTDDYVPFRQENEPQTAIDESQVGTVTFTQEEIKDYINGEAGKLNIPIRIIENVEDIAPEEPRYREKRRSKGWFDVNTGEIVIVAPNHTSIRDAQKTILHEAVAHYGLRGLVGTENFDKLCDRTWAEMTDNDRIYFAAYAEGKSIDSLTQEDIDTFKSDDYANKRIAADEYLASVAENGIMEPTVWQKIKAAIKDLFNKIGINLQIDDADIAYMLWKSKNRITDSDDMQTVVDKSAADAQMRKDIDERFRAVYHGSAASFDRFDQSFMGTGEGAQAYGWGTYVTEVKEIGESYAKAASKNKGTLVKNLYKVDIPEDTGKNYLDWTDDISEENLQDILSRLADIDDPEFDLDYLMDKIDDYSSYYNITGEGLYKMLSRYGFYNNPQKASQALNKIGFVGISYPAQYTTGGRADKAKNYVIFNENDLKITDKTRFRIINNSGYTQREDGTNISVNALEAEKDGTFTEGTFRKVYGVTKNDFNALSMLGVIKYSEWHHTGANFTRSRFYSWGDSDRVVDNGYSYAGSSVQDGSFAQIYRDNKKQIGKLVKEFDAKNWEYETGQEDANKNTAGKEKTLLEIASIFGLEDADKIVNYQSYANRRKIQEDAIDKEFEEKRKQLDVEQDKRKKSLDKWLQSNKEKGNITEYSRIPLGTEPKFFVETEREITGPYDWYNNKPMDNSPVYVSGIAFKSKRLYDSYINKKKEIKDAYLNFENEYSDAWRNIRFRVGEEYTQEEQEIIDKAKQEGTYLKAPNGSNTNLTPKQWAQVRTKAFKDWFGDWENDPQNSSKVVDDNGEPMVVYHGSINPGFTIFKTKGGLNNSSSKGTGIWFSTDRWVSYNYTTKQDYEQANNVKFNGENLGSVYPSFLNVRNPYIVYANGEDFDNIKINNRKTTTDILAKKVRNGIIGNNNDSVIFYNIYDVDYVNEFVVFSPNQIKSATDNVGTFSEDNPDIRFRSSRRNREREVIEIYDIDHEGIANNVKKFAEENLEPGTYDFFTARTGSIYMNAKICGSKVEVRMANHTKAMRYDQSPHLLGDGFSIDFYKDGSVNVSMDIVQNGMTDVEINQFLKGLKEYEDSPIKERVMLLLEGADTVYPNIAEGEMANQLYAMVGDKFVETLNSTIRENHHYALNQEVKKQEDIMQKSQSNIRFTINEALKDNVFHWYATTSDRMLYDISGGYWFNATNGYLKITPNILEGSIFFDPQSIEKKLVSAYFVPARGVNKRKAKKEAIQEYVSDYVTTLSNAPIYDSDKIVEGGSNIVQARYNIDQLKQEYNIWHSAKFGYPAPDVITRFRRMDMPDVSTLVTENNGVYEVNLQNLLPEEEERVRELAKSMSDVTITGDIAKFPDRDMAENAVRNAMMFYGDLSDEITNIPYDVTPLDVMEKLDQRIKKGKLKRIWIDQYQPLKALQTMIEKKLGITIPENLDAWEATGYMDSQAAAQLDEYKARYYEPLLELYVKLSSKAGVSEKELTDYLLIKHGIERNQVFRAEELKDWEEREQEAIKNKNLKTQAQKDAAQQDYEKRREEYIEQLRQKDYSGYYEYFTNELSKKYDTPEDFISYVENTIGSDMTASIWDKIRAATNRTLDIAYNAGNISKESLDYYKSRFMYYVPLRGFEGDTMDETYSSRYKIGGRSSIDKRAGGRASMADNPLVYIATMAATEIDRAAKNDMKKILLRLLNSSNVKDAFSGHYIIEKSDESTEKVTKLPKNRSNITRITHVPGVYQISRKYQYLMLDENGMPMLDSKGNKMWEDRDEEPTPEELANGLARLSYNPKAPKSSVIKTPAQQDESSVSVYINGEEIKITFTNPDLARSVNGQLNQSEQTKAIRKVSSITRYMANNYTTLSPGFIINNIIRDSRTAFLNNFIEHGFKTSAGTVKNYKSALLAMRRYIFKEGIKKRPTDSEISIALNKIKNGNRMTNHDYDVLAYLFISRGGETGYIGMQNVDKYRKDMQDLMKYSDKNTIEVKGELKKRNLMRRGVKFMYDTARLSEDITRFSMFLQSLKQGDSVSKATTKAKNISTNFNRRGSHEGVNWAFASYAFLNATLQGTYRQWQIAKAHPYRTAGIAVMHPFLMGVTEAVLGYFLGGDDDDFGKNYYELSEFKRHNYMCIPTIFSDNFITIPLPQIYRTFHALGCMVVDQIYNKSNPITTKDITTVDLLTTAAQDIMPLQYGSETNLAPTMLQPIATILLNKTFTGAPLYKDTPYNQNTPEYRKAYGNTSNIFVAASEMINDITGGNYAEKGWFEKLPFIGKLNNPAVMQQLALSYLPGLPRVGTQFTIAGESAVRKARESEEDFSLSEVPIAGTLIGDPTDRIPRSVIRSHWYNFTDKAREIKRVDRELLTNMFIDEFAENQNAENIIPAETYSRVANIVLKLLQNDKENIKLEDMLQNGLIPADQMPGIRAQFDRQSRETDKTIKELLEGLYNAGIDIKSK